MANSDHELSLPVGRLPAAIIVAHDNPKQLHRLIDAIAPLPIFLHVDGNADEASFAAMTRRLDSKRVHLLPRRRAGWGHRGVLEAELIGYRTALRKTDADHFILLTGTDYPLASTGDIVATLARYRERSFAYFFSLPTERWGRFQGYDRFVVPQWAWRGHRIALPFPRRTPDVLTLAGGSQSKILCRSHAEFLLHVLNCRRDLVRYFRHVWTPDETVIPTILSSPELGGTWPFQFVKTPPVFFIDWGNVSGAKRNKSPRWLDASDMEALAAASKRREGAPALFARKFGDDADEVIHLIDLELRHVS